VAGYRQEGVKVLVVTVVALTVPSTMTSTMRSTSTMVVGGPRTMLVCVLAGVHAAVMRGVARVVALVSHTVEKTAGDVSSVDEKGVGGCQYLLRRGCW